MTHSEKVVKDSFHAYALGNAAFLEFVNPPMVPAGRLPNGCPTFRPSGSAPFDLHGYLSGGRFVGAEVKETAKHEPSLQIRADTTRSGLSAHQLEALATAASNGCVARIIWDNGGKWGVLLEDKIIHVHNTYIRAIESRQPERGAKSVSWDLFVPIDYGIVGGRPALHWLVDSPYPTEAAAAGASGPA